MTTQQPVWIIGGYQSDFARNVTKESRDIGDLVAETATGSLSAAGISAEQVDVIHVANAMGEFYVRQGHLGSMVASVVPGLSGVPATRHEAACASGGVAVMAAMADLESGRYDVALVLGVEIERNVPGPVGARYLASASWVGHEGDGQDYVWPFTFSRIAEEYDRRYGLEDRHLRLIARQNIANARTNPKAQTRDWSTPPACFADDDAANPRIVGRVRRYDCSQVTDGGAGILLVSDRWLRHSGGSVRGPVARIAGWGHRSASLHLQDKLDASAGADFVFPHVRGAIRDAFSRAGIDDVFELDGIETHDCFTVSQYLAIDHFGITKPGRSGDAVDSGITRRDGALPVNPSGGLIGVGHPVGATGVRMMLDGYLQVTHQAAGYQVQGARRFATLNFGGSTATVVCTVISHGAGA
ncbi:acetyl-CoA acetyltransferase [Streptomyces sp. GC420]|uniref:acetyl-CoA acetyltransferase n=1 Tax=Streptomyces sp. GC420 TaxID=2697568 RepID=UPI0014152FCD|nr:acetyl-CoA acetyltransferase [Streptomyces sp. GC420]NBM14448.1 thiolase domain-containing protein [Streptomyces sp. GC420]